MKGRLCIITTIAAAITAIAATPHVSARRAPLPATEPSAQSVDTTVHDATKSLIESFGDLSKTAGKLSETALKLLEAQEQLDRERNSRNRSNTTPVRSSNTTPVQRNNVYIEPDPSPIPDTRSDEKPVNNVYIAPDDPPYVPTDRDEQQASVPVDTTGETLGSLWDLPQEGSGEGQYIWIPDDKRYAVDSVLKGNIPQGTAKSGEPDLNELTYWRGDSINMAIPSKRFGRYDRKLYNWLIYPKGLWHIGLSANYGELSTDDSEFLSLIDDVRLGGTIYSIKPSVSYFFRNNLCMGLRLAYTKGKMNVESFNVDIDDDMSFNLHDINYLSENYAAAVYLQQYIGLSRRGRFAVFNEIELAAGTGHTVFARPFDGEMRETRTRTRRLNINYSPGVSVMVMKNAGINLSFGVFGFHIRKDRQWENGEESGDRLTSGINFRFNIFNINLGVCVII